MQSEALSERKQREIILCLMFLPKNPHIFSAQIDTFSVVYHMITKLRPEFTLQAAVLHTDSVIPTSIQ